MIRSLAAVAVIGSVGAGTAAVQGQSPGPRRPDVHFVVTRQPVVEQDLFTPDLRPAPVVTMFLGPMLRQRLRPILHRGLRPGTRVVAHGWDMGDWAPDARTEADGRRLFLWIVPADASGAWRWRAAGA